VLWLLSLVYLLHSVDRQIIGVVMEPVKHEFGISDKMLGLLGGLGYAAIFALACLPMGWLIDRSNRVRLLTALLACWSGLTVLCGFASGYWTLLLVRMGVGAAEAGGAPTILSLLSDYFPARQRSLAIGVLYMCTALGVSISFLVGSAIAASYGWRGAFWIAGGPGLCLAVGFLLLREPRRGASETAPAQIASDPVPSLWQATAYVLRHRALVHVTLGCTLASFVLSTLWIWGTSLLIRYHSLELSESGRLVAFAALFQAAGSWLGGLAAKRAARRTVADFGSVAGYSALLGLPFGIALTLVPSLHLAIICLCGMAFFCGVWTGPAFGLAMSLSQPRVRGVVGSFVQLVVNLVGSGLGPFLAGVLSDNLSGGLRSALTICFALNLWAAWHFFAAARCARKMLPDASDEFEQARPVPLH
jgi:MFS family permease